MCKVEFNGGDAECGISEIKEIHVYKSDKGQGCHSCSGSDCMVGYCIARTFVYSVHKSGVGEFGGLDCKTQSYSVASRYRYSFWREVCRDKLKIGCSLR